MSPSKSPNTVTRRELMTGAAAVAGASVLANQAPLETDAATRIEPMTLSKGEVILFQGDSITDAGRSFKKNGPNKIRTLGDGYANMIAARLLGTHPHHGLKIYNRGVGGNKVPDLMRRWQEDTVALKPTVLSILVGVNDLWHKLEGRYDGTVEDYATDFATLLRETREALPETRLVVCEPFVLRCGAVSDRWFPEFDERRAAAREVAREADAIWIPFQTMFDLAVTEETPPSYWAGDGVHPTMPGHALMAATWLERTGLDVSKRVGERRSKPSGE